MITKPSHSDAKPDANLPCPFSSEPKITFSPRSLLLWGGGILLLGLGTSLVGGWFFLQRQLTPLVEDQLSNFLNRPVKLGSVQYFSLNRVRFGSSEILTTATDPAQVSMVGLEVDYDPIKLILTQKLEIGITAIDPNVYLKQGKQGNWILTEFDAVKPNNPIKLKSLRFRNAQGLLLANSATGQIPEPVKFEKLSGQTDFINNRENIKFKVDGQLVSEGKFKVSGVANPKTQETKLLVQGNRLGVTEVDHLIDLPLDFQAGKLDANLEVTLRSQQLPLLQGVANLEQVTAKIDNFPHVLQTQGTLRFQGTAIYFDKVGTRFGAIDGITEGKLDLKKGYALTTKTEPTAITQLLKTFKQKPPSIPLLGTVKGVLQIRGKLNKPRFSVGLSTTQIAKIDKLDFQQINAQLELNDANLLVKEFEAVPTLGGKITGKGKINLAANQSTKMPQFVVEIQGENLATNPYSNLYQTSLPLDLGKVSGNVTLSGMINQPQTLQANGNAYFSLDQGVIKAAHLTYNQGYWQGKIKASGVDLASLNIAIPEEIKTGKLQGIFDVIGKFNHNSEPNINATGTANITLDQGKITANNLELINKTWKTDLAIDGVKLKQLVTEKHPIFEGNLNANLAVTGKLGLGLNNVQAKGQARLDLTQGEIKANNLQLANGNWSSKLITRNVSLNQLVLDTPKKLQGQLNSYLAVSGNINKPLREITGQGNAQLTLASGTINAQTIGVSQGKFTTILASENINLTRFSPDLTGQLKGTIEVAGLLDKITPDTITAKGKLNFSQGIGGFKQPLTTVFGWNGEKLTINQAKASGLSVKGWTEINWAKLHQTQDKLAAIEEFDLDVAISGLDLKYLPLPLANNLADLNYGGKVDFSGAITGTPKKPIIDGKLALINLNLDQFKFESFLAGNLQIKPEKGLKIALAGRNDQINLELDRKSQPVSFDLKQAQMQVKGTREAEKFTLEVGQIPINLLQNYINKGTGNGEQGTVNPSKVSIPPSPPHPLFTQPLLGDLSGEFTLDVNTGEIMGEKVAIANPQLGAVKGEKFTGNFQYIQGNLTLSDGKLNIKNSQYRLDGSLTSTPSGHRINAEIGINQGNIQNILETLHIFDLEDLKRGITPPHYAKAQDLYELKGTSNRQQATVNPSNLSIPPSPPPPLTPSSHPPLAEVGSKNATISDRLTHFDQINTWLQQHQQTRKKASPLPELRELQGNFNGQIALNFAPESGLKANFDLNGQNWKWGGFNLTQIAAKGNWNNGMLTLEPLNLHHKTSQIAFTGRMGAQKQEGKVELVDIPLNNLSEFSSLPGIVDFGGKLNGNITLLGSRDNPEIVGKLVIDKATINQTSLDATQGEFTYRRGRVNFAASSVLGRRTEPLTIKGTFPYQLPFAKVYNTSDRLSLNVNVANEGLTLLDILTKGQVAWLGGQGELQVNVSGRVDPKRGIPTQLNANGIAQVQNAIIGAKVIPNAPLTNVNGQIFFDLDRLKVDSLTGQFSGGQVAIRGSLPLLKEIPQTNPLTVNFDDLALKIPQRYQGGGKGTVQVTGTVVKPKIGGNVELFNGEVLLGDGREGVGKLSTAAEFSNLKLTLGENILITRLPILTFLATGSLTVNGNLNEPKPEGTIILENGLVNLFASQLRLAGGQGNTAKFDPERGLDPYLNVKLYTSATETTRSRVNVDPASAEINEPFSANKDSLQTVRIQATVQGFASDLTNGIELSSQPKRSSTEIVALLGGSFLNPLERGETTLGLANLAGSAVLGPVQGAIGEALGLSELRIFPTQLIDEQERLDDSSIGVAAEAGVDLTNELSVSMQKVLTSDRPPQVGVRYRINDQMLIRGSTNFSDDSRGSIQFEQRF
ncbi:protein of unknown function DUF490 [Rippkaea orientalis PCC 8801]|uniref:Translocation and assembly module TamB C-terminal domain-containing protein n=1 Tax=Rippkaea orientalis (strain PCC 8801 / RF-1) TaxID=41431 RepID=B7K693_RIPO1|nr:translocation/assembly module TamB [Rippkaea orientalis]ACK68146.1 protein of unknown function DUF490 [Rippkaea orientalis PCC 8801]